MTPNTRQRLDSAIKKRYKTSSAPTLTDLIYLKRNFLSRDQCDMIINEFETSPDPPEQEHCPQAFTGVDIWSPFTLKSPRYKSASFSLIHETIEKMINKQNLSFIPSLSGVNVLGIKKTKS